MRRQRSRARRCAPTAEREPECGVGSLVRAVLCGLDVRTLTLILCLVAGAAFAGAGDEAVGRLLGEIIGPTVGATTVGTVYLSTEGHIPASDFFEDFPPDGKHLYQRGTHPLPSRMIRSRKIRGEGKPWLAGITLEPTMVSEAWCHQRGYICFIQEIGRLPMKPGDSFAAAYLIGYFDSVEEMEREADRYRGLTSLAFTKDCWLLSEGVLLKEAAGRFRIAPQGRWPAPSPWHAVVHGKGEVTLNGQRIAADGERVAEVAWAK